MATTLRPGTIGGSVFFGLLFGEDGQFGELDAGDADALETLGDDAVGSGEEADQQIHGSDGGALVIERARMGFAQQADDVVRQKLSVKDQQRFAVAFVLMKKLLELAQELGQVSPQPV